MLIQSIKKEAIIIGHDIHSLAVLILLPITFMIIMTLAMGEQHENLVKKINIQLTEQLLTNRPNNSLSAQPSKQLSAMSLYLQSSGFQVNGTGDIDVTIVMKSGFTKRLLTRQGEGNIALSFAKQVSPQTRVMVIELVKVTLSKLKLHAYMDDVGDFYSSDSELVLADKIALVNKSASVDYLLADNQEPQIFSVATLYSIPSWLIFGLYFIVLPISTTLIKEKQNGTLVRIQTYPISSYYYFFNKALSYGAVSSLQFFLLSIVGLLFVPWLTEQAVLVINNPSLYLISGLFIIFSAIGFAFLLASLVSTYEQAIVLGGGVNILMAALSGFMVPIDIMPDALANIATFSPMYWSAELIKLALSGEGIAQASSYLFSLVVFGSVCFSTALFIFNHKSRKLSWT